jgi:ferredoxin
MGHHIGTKSNLVPLIDRLNQYPIGLVDNDKLRQILSLLFSEEEAYVASRFPLEEATLLELSRRTGYRQELLQALLEQMAEKGLVMDIPYGDKVFYLLLPGLIGFFEFSFMKRRSDLPQAELARLMHDYLYADRHHGQAREFFGSKTPLTRSLVYEEQVPVSSEVTSFESAREIIRQAGFGAVGMCYCRHKKEHLGEVCQKGAPTAGICISLGSAARFMVRRGFAEPRSEAELLAVLERARKLNLTHITDNIRQKPSFICNCCSCCCELLAGVQQGYHDGIAKTGFRVQVREADCSGCGVCVAACNVKALALGNGSVLGRWSLMVRESACLGCGACVPTCRAGALVLVPGEPRAVPETRRRLLKQILKEKGRLTPYLVSGTKKKVRSLLRLRR